jgi:ribosomal protein L29
MKKKELQKYRSQTLAEILKEIRELRIKLVSLRSDLAIGKLNSQKEIKATEKSLAQLLTLQTVAEKSKS